jgi:hypothetical protein
MTVLIVLSAWIGMLFAIAGLCVAARRGDACELGTAETEPARPGEMAHPPRPRPQLIRPAEGDLGVARRAA